VILARSTMNLEADSKFELQNLWFFVAKVENANEIVVGVVVHKLSMKVDKSASAVVGSPRVFCHVCC